MCDACFLPGNTSEPVGTFINASIVPVSLLMAERELQDSFEQNPVKPVDSFQEV